MTSKPQTKEFQAEVKQLLDIVIHSLYTEKEIFLRELISNSADALEKFRHQQLLEEEVFDAGATLDINITVNDDEHTCQEIAIFETECDILLEWSITWSFRD